MCPYGILDGVGMKNTAVLLFLFYFVSVLGYPETQANVKEKDMPKSAHTALPRAPSPTAVPNEISKKTKPIPVNQKSTVFNKKSIRSQADSSLGLEGYFEGLDRDRKENFYNQLNANLFSSLSSQPKPLSPEEKILKGISIVSAFRSILKV